MRMSGIVLVLSVATSTCVGTVCGSQKVTDVEATIHVDPTVTGASVFISRCSTLFCTIEPMNWPFYENVMRWPETKFTLYHDEQGVLQQPAPPDLFHRCGRTPLTAVFAFPCSHWKSSSSPSVYDFSSFSSSQRILTRITCGVCSQWLITRFYRQFANRRSGPSSRNNASGSVAV